MTRPIRHIIAEARALGLWQPFLADCRTAAWALPLAALFFVLAWVALPPSGDPAATADPLPRDTAVDVRATGSGR